MQIMVLDFGPYVYDSLSIVVFLVLRYWCIILLPDVIPCWSQTRCKIYSRENCRMAVPRKEKHHVIIHNFEFLSMNRTRVRLALYIK